MPARYKIEYSPGDRVHIKPLDYEGRILNVLIEGRGVEYRVRYFHNGQENIVYFWGDELKKGPGRKNP